MLMEILPSITIGVPTYNRAWCLHRFLDAVEQLDYPKNKIRIVFVDNFSDDGTMQMLEEFKERVSDDYEKIIIIPERSNIPQARNTCVKSSMGQYLLFLDSDVIPPPDTAKRMLNVFASNPRAAIVGFPYRCEPSTLAENMYFSKQPRTVHTAMVVGMGCTMIRRGIFDEIGFFDPKYEADEDADLTIRASKSGHIALLDPSRMPLHLTRERLYGFLPEIIGYCRYSFGILAKYHFKILKTHKPRWMRNKVLFYSAMVASIPIAIVGVALGNLILVLPLVLLYGVVFTLHFSRARGMWRLINPILFPLFGMSFAMGIWRELIRWHLRRESS